MGDKLWHSSLYGALASSNFFPEGGIIFAQDNVCMHTRSQYLQAELDDLITDYRSWLDTEQFFDWLTQFRIFLMNDYRLPHKLAFSLNIYRTSESMVRKFDWSILNTRLSAEQASNFEAWMRQNKPEPEELVTTLCGSGYKVSISWVDSSNSFVVTVSGRTEGRNMKKSIQSWSDDPIEALALCEFKRNVIFANGEWHDTAERTNWG